MNSGHPEPIVLNLTKDNRCPFCKRTSGRESLAISYRETETINPRINDFSGKYYECAHCGIYYCDTLYKFDDLLKIYSQQSDLVKQENSSPGWASVVQAAKTSISARLYKRLYSPSKFQRLTGSIFLKILSPLKDYLIYQTLHLFSCKEIHPHCRMLDIGGGDGVPTKAFKSAFSAEIYGTEPFPELAVEASFFKEIYWGDIPELKIPREYFNFVLARQSFYRIQDPVKGLRRILESLKNNGHFIILQNYCPDPESLRKAAGYGFPNGRFFIKDLEKFCAILKKNFPVSIGNTKLLSLPRSHFGKHNTSRRSLSLILSGTLSSIKGFLSRAKKTDLVIVELIKEKPILFG